MNKREAVVISAYTGTLLCEFKDLHEYIEAVLGRSVFTHELGNKELVELIKFKSEEEFLEICSSIDESQ